MKTSNLFPVLLTLTLIVLPPALRAQTWTGGGPDNNIDDPVNWGGTTPAFDGSQTPTFASGGTTCVVDTNVSFYGLSLSAPSAFNILGPGTLTNGAGGINVSGSGSTPYTIACPLEITANQLWPISSGAVLTNSGCIDDGGNNYNLFKSLTGSLYLLGTNTYGGTTTVNGGSLYYYSIGMVGGGGSSLGAPTNVANGTISVGGSGTLEYNGTGAATSDRIINITGTATIYDNGGALTLNGGFTGSGTTALRNGGTITVNGPIMLGSSTLTRTSSGTAILTNPTNTFGTVVIYQGTLSVNSISNSGVSSALGSGSTIEFGQATTQGKLQFTGPSGGSCNRTLEVLAGTTSTGGGILENTVAGQTLTMSGNLECVGGTAPSFQLIGAGNGVMSGTISNPSGSLSIAKSGTGTWTLSGTNTYTGPTTVSGGTLLVNGYISTNTVTVAAGATLGGTGTIGGPVTVSANGNLAPGGLGAFGTLALTNSSAASLTLNAGNNLTFVLQSPATAGATYDALAVTGGLVLNGTSYVIPGYPADGTITNGAYTLMTYAAKTGSGTLTFTNGATTMGDFTLTVGATSVILNVNTNITPAVQSLTWQGNLSGTWDTTTANWVNSLTRTATTYADGTNVLFDDTAVNFNITNGSASPGSVSFQNSANNYSIMASIAGPGTLSTSGFGTVSLLSSNNYAGGTTLNAGTLAVSNNYALGTGALTIAGSTTLASLANLTLSNNVTLNAMPAFSLGGNTLTLAGNITGGVVTATLTLSGGGLTFGGTNFLAAATNSPQEFMVNGGVLTLAGGSTTLSNFVVYTSGGNILVTGGTHYLVGPDVNFAGITLRNVLTITGGAVHTSRFSMGYGSGASATFNLNGGYFDTTTFPQGGAFNFANGTGASDVTTLNLNGGTLVTTEIEKGGGSAPAANNIINLNGGTLKAGGASGNFLYGGSLGLTVNVCSNGAMIDTGGYSITLANALLDGGGGGGLTKLDTGTLDLTGASTYTGQTTVSNGTLRVDGSIGGGTSAGAVIVITGATLGGMGAVDGAITVQSGGTLAPGSSALGTLTVNNNLTLSSGAGALFRLNTTNAPATNDSLVVTGTQNIAASTLTVTNLGPALVAGDSFTLLGTPTSGFATVNLPFGYIWTNMLAINGSIQVLAVGSPNPSPTNITCMVNGNQMVLNWPAGQGWQLQAQTNQLGTGLTTNWVNVAGATPPYTNNIVPANATVFYRLQY